MTLALLPTPAAWMPTLGGAGSFTTSIGSNSTFTFNGAADKLGFVFQASSATPPDQINFSCSIFSTLGTIDVTLETVDLTTGTPSGTPVTNSATASTAVTSTGTQSVTGLAGTAVLTPGDLYAVVLTSAAVFAGNFQVLRTTGTGGGTGLPYSCTKDSAGAWAKASTATVGYAIGFFASGGVAMQMPGFTGAYAATMLTVTDASTPDERGSRFMLPFPTTCYGAVVVMGDGSTPADVNSFALSLHSDHTGTPVQLATQAFDGDAQGAQALRVLMFGTPVDLAANTVYALTVKATSTSGFGLLRHVYASAAEVGCYLDPSFYATTRNNAAGAFTDVTTDTHGVFPLLGKFDDGAGGGGGSGGMLQGNLRGNFQ